MSVPVVIMGLGEIGQQLARALVSSRHLEIVGALDLSPERIGRSLSDITRSATPDVVVTDRADLVLPLAKGGVLLHATGSRLSHVVDEIESSLRAGLHVVSTCEELAFPWIRHPQLAERLDALATRCGVTVLGTGVNPGFVLDRLPVTLAQAAGRVEHVWARRTVDLTRRRAALHHKVGVGLTPEEFARGIEGGTLGHVGLMESAALVALGVGDSVDGVDEELSPILSEAPVRGTAGMIESGHVIGIRQVARAMADGRELVRLELQMSVGAQNVGDEVRLRSDPPLHLKIEGGVPGEAATAWAVVHAAQVVSGGQLPGLVTVLDLPLVGS